MSSSASPQSKSSERRSVFTMKAIFERLSDVLKLAPVLLEQWDKIRHLIGL